jgi:hypothetical protein
LDAQWVISKIEFSREAVIVGRGLLSLAAYADLAFELLTHLRKSGRK